MTDQKLIGNISFAVLLNLLIKPAGLLLENKVQDTLGHAAFGTYMALYSLAFAGGFLVDPGLNQYTAKTLAGNQVFQPRFLPVIFPIKWIFTFLYPVLVGGMGWGLGYRGQTLFFLVLISGGYSLTQFIFFLRAILQGRQHFSFDALASVGEKLVLIFLLLALLWTGITLQTFIYARVAAAFLTFLVLLIFVKRWLGSIPYKLTGTDVKAVLFQSLPFALITLVYGVNEKIDMVMLERLYSGQEAGIYAAAYRWVDVVMMYLWTVLPLFFARFAGQVANPGKLRALVRLGQLLVAIPIIFICVWVYFYGPVLFWQYRNSTPGELKTMELNLVILFANVMVHGFFAIYSTLLTATGKEKAVAKLVGVSILVNVALNCWLIPVYGSVAAAANTLLCALLVSVGYLVLVHRSWSGSLPGILIGKLLLAALLLAGVFKALTAWHLAWLPAALLAGLLYTGLLFLLRILSWRELKWLVNRPLKP